MMCSRVAERIRDHNFASFAAAAAKAVWHHRNVVELKEQTERWALQ